MVPIHKKVKKSALRKALHFVSKKLSEIDDNKYVAALCEVDVSRVSEARRERAEKFSYITLQKFILGGIVKLEDLVEIKGLEPQEKLVLQNLILASPEIQAAAQKKLSEGWSPADIAAAIERASKS